MRRLLAAGALVLIFTASSASADEAGALLDKALDDLVRHGYVGDTSAAERYLGAIVEQDPDHLEALWQLLYIRLAPLKNVALPDRAEPLAGLSPAFTRLARLAKQSKQEAFLHFMTAIHAGLYNDYERARVEIDRAVALDPRSVRYRIAKGRLLVDQGEWVGRDAEVEQGIVVLGQARDLLRSQPSRFARDEFFDFHLAVAFSHLSQPDWREVAEHYRLFIERTEPSVIRAFALNNASIAYRKLGECDKAREAAEGALVITKFGAAQLNKRYADFCLEMQKIGLIAHR